MKKFWILFLLVVFSRNSNAQELNCTVNIITAQVEGSEKKIYNTLQTAIGEFMNNTTWTDDKFTNQERIECSIQITISDRTSSDDFKGSIQVSVRRPVYKTSYYSPLLSFNDENFSFKYIEFQPIEFNETGTNPNLSAVLAYYAYIILGLDYDTFSPSGGTPYFQKAQSIVSRMQNVPDKGWKSFESTKNRYWLAESFSNPIFRPLREFLYIYHRQGLDIMTEKKEDAVNNIANAIESLKKVHSEIPASFLMQTIFYAKSDEIVNIFKDAFPEVKTRMISTLSEIDPSNLSKYQTISQK
ncbi:MAG TPA: DUF4835 family protein [Bacteroidia bacterium]|nr:DUF4835 family protein [Bacteroidia bacterium]